VTSARRIRDRTASAGASAAALPAWSFPRQSSCHAPGRAARRERYARPLGGQAACAPGGRSDDRGLTAGPSDQAVDLLPLASLRPEQLPQLPGCPVPRAPRRTTHTPPPRSRMRNPSPRSTPTSAGPRRRGPRRIRAAGMPRLLGEVCRGHATRGEVCMNFGLTVPAVTA
jgi:hypothetical protein